MPGAPLSRLPRPRYQAQPRPLPSPKATEEAERGARRRARRGWSRNSSVRPQDPGAPEPQLCPGQIGPARRAGEGKAPTLRSRQDQGPERTTCPCLSPESSRVCPTKGGREAPETFPHAFPLSPSPSPLPRPLLPSAPQHWRGSGLAEAGGGARAAGVTCRESFQLLGAVTHPQGRASGRGQLSAPQLPLLRLPRRPLLLQQPLLRLRSGPSPSLAHRGLIGSANPRPWACSRRHLPLARPPGPRLPRPFPPRAAAAPGTSGTRRANFLQGL